MRTALLLTVLATGLQLARAEDITFTNRTATFRDLQGKFYRGVQLVRGDLDGLIWRDGASGGRICYTNLDPEVLQSFGISSNRIEVARVRAQKKALADARYRSQVIADARPKTPAQPADTNSPPLAMRDSLTVPYSGSAPDSGFGLGIPYSPLLFNGSLGPPAPSAPSAAPAPSAGSALSAAGVPGAGLVPGAFPTASADPALSAVPARSAPSAPSAFAPRPIPHRH